MHDQGCEVMPRLYLVKPKECEICLELFAPIVKSQSVCSDACAEDQAERWERDLKEIREADDAE